MATRIGPIKVPRTVVELLLMVRILQDDPVLRGETLRASEIRHAVHQRDEATKYLPWLTRWLKAIAS